MTVVLIWFYTREEPIIDVECSGIDGTDKFGNPCCETEKFLASNKVIMLNGEPFTIIVDGFKRPCGAVKHGVENPVCEPAPYECGYYAKAYQYCLHTFECCDNTGEFVYITCFKTGNVCPESEFRGYTIHDWPWRYENC